MNPKIPADYAELGHWLLNFATSHAKREDRTLEAHVDTEGEREGRSYGLRLVRGAGTGASVLGPLTELTYTEIAEGRTRFAWCEVQARRVRDTARELANPATSRSNGLRAGAGS